MDQQNILNQLARSRRFSTFAPRDSQVELLLHEFDVTTCEIVMEDHEKNKHHQSVNLEKTSTRKKRAELYTTPFSCQPTFAIIHDQR